MGDWHMMLREPWPRDPRPGDRFDKLGHAYTVVAVNAGKVEARADSNGSTLRTTVEWVRHNSRFLETVECLELDGELFRVEERYDEVRAVNADGTEALGLAGRRVPATLEGRTAFAADAAELARLTGAKLVRVPLDDWRARKLGRPLGDCPRCGGTGTYPSNFKNGVCFRCGGTGDAP